MLFAAGFGTRMAPLTQTQPKALIPVAGRALLDHALDLVDAAGVTRKVVNLHYRGDQIKAHLAGRQDITFSPEPEILETGGGLRAALPLLGEGPVFTLNSDAVWTGPNPLKTLRLNWRDDMSALVLLAPKSQLHGFAGPADFTVSPDGRIARANGGPGYVYLGAQIIDPLRLAGIPKKAFSLNLLWDQMIAEGRAYGVVHPGGWCDVGRPESIAIAEAMLRGADVS
ncbi:MAG: MurNAc alpha-1-phosphate uridylyltransferase [Pseudorhodobacter sp.]|jgi:MurNAc alpha-1-phosphate uridylyltransferase